MINNIYHRIRVGIV